MHSRRRTRSEALPGRASPEREAWGRGRVDICWASRERAAGLRRPDPRARSRLEGTLLTPTQGIRRSLHESRFRSGHGQRSPAPSLHGNSARGGRARVSLGFAGHGRTGSGNRFVIGKASSAPGPLAAPARIHARRRSVALGDIFRADRRHSARRGTRPRQAQARTTRSHPLRSVRPARPGFSAPSGCRALAEVEGQRDLNLLNQSCTLCPRVR